MTQRNRIIVSLIISFSVLFLDQATKLIIIRSPIFHYGETINLIPFVLNSVFAWNTGVTFGFFHNDHSWMIVIPAAMLIMAILIRWIVRTNSALVSVSVATILGGALGNVIDRVRYGKVVDFLHLHLGTLDPFPYIFNVGDSAIVLGVAALMFDALCCNRPSNTATKSPA